ncbi:MAG TPA: hypothetical protein VI911_04040 [Patescibacteria group bacterium]|nr:hypothetical protein [Patescibacteria group bacterium]
MTFKETLEIAVRDKTMVRYRDKPIDLFTASAMLNIIKSLSKKNQENVERLVSTDRGFEKFLNFTWKQYK